jgi:hypothetical protein
MTQEALKLALEFIENSECGTADLEARIKEALAQTEQEPKIGCVNHDCDKCKTQTQEPVAWFRYQQGSRVYYDSKKWDDCQPLYTTPPQRTWVGLTRDEQSFVYSNLHNATSREDSFWVDFANAIEAKLKEKNT